jgi:hypothetical protein
LKRIGKKTNQQKPKRLALVALGLISLTFSVSKQSSFCANDISCFKWQQHLAKMCQNMALGAKAVA